MPNICLLIVASLLIIDNVDILPAVLSQKIEGISRPHLKWSPKHIQPVHTRNTLRGWTEASFNLSYFFTPRPHRRRQQYVFQEQLSHERTFRDVSRDVSPNTCEENLCQHGAQCVNSRCLCLAHFTGRYCESLINYCEQTPEPCPPHVRCVPRLGGYTCQCPLTFMGINCSIPRIKPVKYIEQADFLFHPEQYANISSYSCLYASRLGDIIWVKVDMGDGTAVTLRRSAFQKMTDAREKLLRQFFLPLSIPSGPLYICFIRHTYQFEGIYNVTVLVRNRGYIVFSSRYTVRVQKPSHCQISTRLINCPHSRQEPMKYRRWHQIVILSATRVDCPQPKLEFTWEIHKVNSFDMPISEETLYEIPRLPKMDGPHLRIMPYTLPFGHYVIRQHVKMLSPKLGLVANDTTFLGVLRAPLIVRLKGGSFINSHWNEDLVLDASGSEDPNVDPKLKEPLTFSWSCVCTVERHLQARQKEMACSDHYCLGLDKPLNDTSSKLVVPAFSLRRYSNYHFKVAVYSHREDKVSMGYRSQKVNVVSYTTPVIRINCLRNCKDQTSNPLDVTSFEAVCLSCRSMKDLEDFSWSIYTEKEYASVNVSATEFGLEYPQLIVYEGAFKPGVIYRVIFSGIDDDPLYREGFIRSDRIGRAEQVLTFNEAPANGSCSVTPETGYGMLTNFSVQCSNYSDHDNPLSYEVMQFWNLDELDTAGVIVGYGTTSGVENFTLAPGLKDYNYVTTLIVYIIDSWGFSTTYHLNVTVLPAIAYLRDPEEVLYRLERVGSGNQSPLGMMLMAGNIPGLVQLALSSGMTMLDFIESGDHEQASISHVNTTVLKVRESLTDFLDKVPIYTSAMARHVCTALDIVIKSSGSLPGLLPFTSSPALLRTGNIITRIVRVVAEHRQNNISISRLDMQDIGICLVSVTSSVFGKAHDFHSNETIKDLEARSGKMDPQFLEELNLDHVTQENTYRNFTAQLFKDISEFSGFYLQHKVKQERSSLIPGPYMTLMLKKAHPRHLDKDSLSIVGLAGVDPYFPEHLMKKEVPFSARVLLADTNPFWWHRTSKNINYPFVHVEIFDEHGSQVEIPMKVELHAQTPIKPQTVHGNLEVKPYWTLDDLDIEVHRVRAPHGCKLLIQFMPLKEDVKLQVVVKKGYRPELQDFWTDAITIPQKTLGLSEEVSRSLFVDDPGEVNGSLFFIGILPHKDTLQALKKSRDFAPFHPRKLKFEAEVIPGYRYGNISMGIMQDSQNTSIPYEMAVYGARCLTWDHKQVDWFPGCEVTPATTTTKVVCRCPKLGTLSVAVDNALHDRQMFDGVKFFISFMDNPVVPFLEMLLCVIFLGLFTWACFRDREDLQRRFLVFLEDNDPTHLHCYLLMVETGRRVRAGTTSRVAIQIEGTDSTSAVHLLTTSQRPVLTRGAQDWFVLKTPSSLGDLIWIHMWHDYSGAHPDWYCSRVVIHNIHTHHVWIFEVEHWLSPLYGNGTMSCSVFRTLQNEVFARGFLFRDHIGKQFDKGQHGWFSIFHRQSYCTFDRRQRVAVAMAHTAMLLLCTAFLTERSRTEEPADQLNERSEHYHWSIGHFLTGFLVAFIIYPLHILLVTLFRCVTPLPDWSREYFYYSDSSSEELPRKAHLIEESPLIVDPTPVEKLKRFFRRSKPPAVALDTPIRDTASVISGHVTSPLRRRVVPLRRSGSQSYMTSTTPPVDQPLVGRRVQVEWHCLPAWFLFVLWAIVLAILGTCVYLTALQGITYSWTVSLRFLVTFFSALLFSMFVLEPVKLLVCALLAMYFSSRLIKIEDRSDLVKYLDGDLTLNEEEIAYKQKEVAERRRAPAYRPLPRKKVELLRRNVALESSFKSIVTDVGVYLLFVVILTCIISGIGDKLRFHAFNNLQVLLNGQNAYDRMSFNSINHEDAFINYLNQTFIPAVHAGHDYRGILVHDEGRTDDPAYYLIGVPRLRQVREKPEDCKVYPHLGWICRDGRYRWIPGDTTDYVAGWRPSTKRRSKGHHRVVEDWQYEDSYRLWTPATSGDVSLYSGGGYVALLGRTQRTSRTALEYLVQTGWFDRLTRAVTIELSLFCPDRHLVAVIVLLVERAVTGAYSVHRSIDFLKMLPAMSRSELFILMMFAVLILLVVLLISQEARRLIMVRPGHYFTRFWNLLGFFMTLLGLLLAGLFVLRAVFQISPISELEHASDDKFMSFYFASRWDTVLQSMCAVMLFLVLLKMWHVLTVKYRFQLMSIALGDAAKPLLHFLAIFVLLLCGFALVGYLLFNSTSSRFRSLVSAGMAIVSFAQRSFRLGDIANTPLDTSRGTAVLAGLFFVTFFIIVIVVLRWMFAAILIHRFQVVRHLNRDGRHLQSLRTSSRSERHDHQAKASFVRQNAVRRIELLVKKRTMDKDLREVSRDLAMITAVIERIHKLFHKQRKPQSQKMQRIPHLLPTISEDAEYFQYTQQHTEEPMASALRATVLENRLKHLSERIDMLLANKD